MSLSLDVPINGLSFGQTSVCILRELFRRGLEPNVFPISNQGDLGAYEISDEFRGWLEKAIAQAPLKHKRADSGFKLWHLNGALPALTDRRVLMTFHETDTLTDFEANAAANQDAVLVTSSYTKMVMERAGLNNVVHCPLGFDDYSFFETHKQYFEEGIICFGMGGKLENRKHHLKVLKAWVKRYGNNPRYKFNLALTNGFMDQQSQNAMVAQALEGKRYFNLNFLPFMKANKDYNDFLNANNIFFGMSGGEGFDLPVFQSAALGKHIVALRAHVYEDYLNTENACLVNPSGLLPVYDGVFFHQGQPFNQGNIFDWNEDEFIVACETAEARYLANKSNKAGKLLQEKFTYAKTVDTILKACEK